MTGRALAPVDLAVRGLGRSYGTVRAVDGVSLNVPAGSITALLGGNGAGKSTSMRLMLGLTTGEGTTSYGGRRLVDHPQPTSVVGAFLGAPAFHPGRTARDHLRCLAAGTTAGRSRVQEVLELVGLADRAGSRPRGFSTGMRQRLGIAAALLHDPSVLVLDEPANGLDPHAVIGMRDLLAAHAERGGTVLVSTHVLAEVELVADRVVVLAGGRVVADGSVTGLLTGDGADAVLEVACGDPARLADAVRAAGGTARRRGDDGLEVTGVTARDLALLARGCDVLVWTLTPRRRSMEEYFLHTVGSAAADGLSEEAPCLSTS